MRAADPIPLDAAVLVARARDALFHAEVELFCDHQAEAMQSVRVARQAAARCGIVPIHARLEIEEATWHIRHDDTVKALYSLERARTHLSRLAAVRVRA